MRTFDVYTGKEAVKKGFSWPGFFFTFLWAFVKGLPGIGVLLFAVIVGLTGLESYAEAERSPGMRAFALVMSIVVPLIIGFMGNNWRRSKLTKRGYILTKTIEAGSPEAAIAVVPRESEIEVQTTAKESGAEAVETPE